MRANAIIHKRTAPSAWASYLINGDASGIDASEREAANRWVESLGFRAPVDCEDAGFIKRHDAYEIMPLAADCQTYTFLERPEPPRTVKLGDRIKFRAACREGAETVVRKVNGFDRLGWPTVRYRGYADFSVRPSEIKEVVK